MFSEYKPGIIAATALAAELKNLFAFCRTPALHKDPFILKLIQPHPLQKFITIIQGEQKCVVPFQH